MLRSAFARTLVSCALAVAAALTTTVAPVVAQTITEYAIPTANSGAYGITAGPDGNLWFTEASSNKIGKVTPSGTFTEYVIPTGNSGPVNITAGPDGNLWFTESASDEIGRVTTSGTFADYLIPTANSAPIGITAGPDGNLWFTEFNGNKIGQVTTSGLFTEYLVPTAVSLPAGITAGPDGYLWFTESSSNQIGKVTTTGTFTEYIVPTANSGPRNITAGPDGNLWFTENLINQIGTVTTTGTFTEYVMPTGSFPDFIAAGPDGNLWFTQNGSDKITKVTTTGTFTEYVTPTNNSGPVGITAGPDGNVWFTESSANKIGRVDLVPPSATATPTPTATPTLTATPTPTPGPTPAGDHFTCYKAGQTSGFPKFAGIENPPGISLIDQFGSSTLEVKKPKYLCAPTNKNSEDPTAPAHPEHLEGYQIKNATTPLFPTNIKIVDQFNPGGLFVDAKKQSHLLVPTVKNLSGTPPTPAAFVTDHFECYKIRITSGTPKFPGIPSATIQDQFGPMTVTVKKPKFLCNPVNKEGEDPTAPAHVNHLVCYQVKQLVPPDPAKFVKIVGVFVNNQFGPETLDVKKPSELCVPALKNP